MFEALKQEFGEWPSFKKAFPDYTEREAFFDIEFKKEGIAILRIPNAGGMVEINLSLLQEKFVQEEIVANLNDVDFSWGTWTIKSEESAGIVLNRLKQLTKK